MRADLQRHEAAARIAGATEAFVTGRPDDIDPMLDGIEELRLSDTLSAWQWLAEAVGRWAARAGADLDADALVDRAGLPARVQPVVRELLGVVRRGVRVAETPSPVHADEDELPCGRGELIGGAVLVLIEMIEEVADATGRRADSLVRELPPYGEVPG